MNKQKCLGQFLTQYKHLVNLYPNIMAEKIIKFLDNYEIQEFERLHELELEESYRSQDANNG